MQEAQTKFNSISLPKEYLDYRTEKIKKARESPITILAKFVIMNCLNGVIADLPYFIFFACQRILLISVNFIKPNKGWKNYSEVDPRASDAIR